VLNFDRSTVKHALQNTCTQNHCLATSGFLTALECTKFVFGRGFTQDPLRELTALPRPYFSLEWKGGEWEGKRGDGRGGDGEAHLTQIPESGPVFTALHRMQTRSSDENSVCLSVCPSVHLSVTHVDCDKTVERSVQIYIPYERTFSLVF